MATFWTACIWGLGVSCGATGGLLVFFVVKDLLDRCLRSKVMLAAREVNEEMLKLLAIRNGLTAESVTAIERIAKTLEEQTDSD